MRWRVDIGTYLIVTAVTILIWYYAAGETRDERTLDTRLEFTVTHASQWIVQPASIEVRIVAEGSQRAIANAEDLSRLTIDMAPTPGTQVLDVTEAVRNDPSIRETGITVVSTDPSTIELDLDEMIRTPARVLLARLPGVETVDRPVIEPDRVEVAVPSRALAGGRLVTVDAMVDRSSLEGLPDGVANTLEHVRLRAPDWLTAMGPVTIEPPEVSVRFTIRSKIVEVQPPVPVRVQIAGSPEDEFAVELDPIQLRDVTVSVPADLGQKIASGEATVFAVVYLKTSEKEASIKRKPVTFFVAILPDGSGRIVEARVGGAEQAPEIGLHITERGRD